MLNRLLDLGRSGKQSAARYRSICADQDRDQGARYRRRCALSVAVICRFLIAEYRALGNAATAQSGRRYVRTEVILDTAEHAAMGEDPAGFTSAGYSPGASLVDSSAIPWLRISGHGTRM
jgi:hypothetical protein